jgi:hypothetical protein
VGAIDRSTRRPPRGPRYLYACLGAVCNSEDVNEEKNREKDGAYSPSTSAIPGGNQGAQPGVPLPGNSTRYVCGVTSVKSRGCVPVR